MNDFEIIIKGKRVPVNINNEIIKYTQDLSIQNTHLQSKIFYKKTLIAQGIILDFYKEFEVLQDFNHNFFTHILTFEYNNKKYQSYTKFGKKIYEMKYLKNPPIKQGKRESYINEIVSHINGYINYLKKKHTNLKITYIPSDSLVSNEIADKLSSINNIPLKHIVSKNNNVSSKNITHLSTQQFNKYSLDFAHLNIDDNLILIDDVVGTSASLCEIMYKIYDFNKKVNFFFIAVKDVKR